MFTFLKCTQCADIFWGRRYFSCGKNVGLCSHCMIVQSLNFELFRDILFRILDRTLSTLSKENSSIHLHNWKELFVNGSGSRLFVRRRQAGEGSLPFPSHTFPVFLLFPITALFFSLFSAPSYLLSPLLYPKIAEGLIFCA